MSLQAKFASLLGTIGLTVVLALAISVAAMNFMHNEVRLPFQVMSSALIQLQTVKYAVEGQRASVLGEAPIDGVMVGPTVSPEEHRADFESRAEVIGEAFRRLLADDSTVTVTGKTSLANLRTRIADVRDLSEQWFAEPTQARRDAAAAALNNAFMLARRIESRIIADTNDLLVYASDLRRRIISVTAFAMLVGLLACVLGLTLIRRWVIRPVADLRTAAARIASGDFAHRIPIKGADELASLSTEVNSMAGMVKAMQDEAVQRQRLAAVGEVVRRIAHNLRSPLAGIRGLAELTRKDLEGPSIPADVRDDLGENQSRIIGAVDRFEQWLRHLLDASRPLEIVHRTVSPRDWLESVAAAYRPAAQARRVELRLESRDCPPLASFDPRHLEHALGALIANALDAAAASPPGPEQAVVQVECASAPPAAGETGGFWEIRVEDNGGGVPPDLRERIFTPYFTTKREGTGIGLALAQQVIRAHGGTLRLVDTVSAGSTALAGALPNRGSVFSARLPIGPIGVVPSLVATAGHPEVASGQSSRH